MGFVLTRFGRRRSLACRPGLSPRDQPPNSHINPCAPTRSRPSLCLVFFFLFVPIGLMLLPCLSSSALSCLSDSTMSASTAHLPRFRPTDTQLNLTNSADLPTLLSPFAGRPGESCSNFVYKLILCIDALHRSKDDHRKVVMASLYLDGPALTWFRGLLRTNAEVGRALDAMHPLTFEHTCRNHTWLT